MTLTEKMRMRDELSKLLYGKTETQLRHSTGPDHHKIQQLDRLTDFIERKLAAFERPKWWTKESNADGKFSSLSSFSD